MIKETNPLAIGADGVMFTAGSVLAIARNDKTQTRRLFTSGNSLVDGAKWSQFAYRSLRFADAWVSWVDQGSPAGNLGPYLKVPRIDPELKTDDWKKHGTVHRVYPRHRPGDRWYVKEGWGVNAGGGWAVDPCVSYRAPNDEGEMDQNPIDPRFMAEVMSGGKFRWHTEWRSPLMMPRWAARYFLEVTAVRIERLQSISYDDLKAEGMEGIRAAIIEKYSNIAPPGETTWPSYQDLYERIWDDMHKDPGTTWADNPWIVAYTFQRITTDGQ